MSAISGIFKTMIIIGTKFEEFGWKETKEYMSKNHVTKIKLKRLTKELNRLATIQSIKLKPKNDVEKEILENWDLAT